MKKTEVIRFIAPSFVDLGEIPSEGNDSSDNEQIHPWFSY